MTLRQFKHGEGPVRPTTSGSSSTMSRLRSIQCRRCIDYTACMNDYVANAQADMNLIRDRANKAAAEQTSN